MKKIAFFLALVLAACSSTPAKDKTTSDPVVTSDVSPPTTTDEGVDASQPTPVEDGGVVATDSGSTPSVPMNQATCISACQAKYPAAEAKNKQLDATCFLGGTCSASCNDLKPGKLFQPTEVDGGGCDTVTPDSYPITTTSQACSDCLNTTPTCCSQWISIFSSTDGRALNTCTNVCYTDFKN
jgi:hypothetical protein